MKNVPDGLPSCLYLIIPVAQSDRTPQAGGGMPVLQYWAEHTLSTNGPKIWQTLNHHSACLSCAWGTGGQSP